MQKINNITDLRISLSENYANMKAKKMTLEQGRELARTAGKILNSCKVELEYNQNLGIKKKIKFLETK